MNFDTLAMHLGTNRVAHKCQKRSKVPVFSQKCLGRNFGLLLKKLGYFFILLSGHTGTHLIDKIASANFAISGTTRSDHVYPFIASRIIRDLELDFC